LGALKRSVRCFFSGFSLLFTTILAVLTSAYYNNAIAKTATDVMANAVILLFISSLLTGVVPHLFELD